MTVEPNYLVWLAFGFDADDATPDWVDVSADLRSIKIRRGSDTDLDRNQPGTLAFVLDNLTGVYDNENSASAYAGMIVPNVQVRVLAEWDGEIHARFAGYLDKVDLTYPDDTTAWATFRATDGFKALARTQLPASVWDYELETDGPVIWWKLNEGIESTVALNSGAGDLGTIAGTEPLYNGTYVGPPQLGAQGLIDRDPDPGIGIVDDSVSPGTTGMGVMIPQATFDPYAYDSWAIEMWWRPGDQPAAFVPRVLWSHDADVTDRLTYDGVGGGRFRLYTTGETDFASAGGKVPHVRYHIVAKHGPSRVLALYVNGVKVTGGTTAAGQLPLGANYFGYYPGAPTNNAVGTIDEIAIHTGSPSTVDPLEDTRIAAHYAAGTSPWTGDTPGARFTRIADIIGFPTALRDFDTGTSVLQGASLGTSALEHLYKTAESDFGLFFMSRSGQMRFIGRDALHNQPALAAFGPDADQVQYRAIRFDNSDELIRNPVTVSRAGGLAQTSQDDALLAKYWPNQFTLDGLFHNSDGLSKDAATFYLEEGKESRRRITGLSFGPFDEPQLYAWFPLLLTAEIGNVYDVTFRPPAGDDLVQTSVLEGTTEQWNAQTGIGTVDWSFSPVLGSEIGGRDFALELDSLDGNGLDYDYLAF